jgi:hypothetical protein
MMPKPGDKQPPASTFSTRLDSQEQWLTARLDGLRAMKSALARLNEVLSDDQKQTANDLLAPHMGMGMMAMMPAAGKSSAASASSALRSRLST